MVHALLVVQAEDEGVDVGQPLEVALGLLRPLLVGEPGTHDLGHGVTEGSVGHLGLESDRNVKRVHFPDLGTPLLFSHRSFFGLVVLFDGFLAGHDVAEGFDGDVGVGGALEGPIVLVVLDGVLKVSNKVLEEVGHVVLLVPVVGGAEPEKNVES